MPKPLMLLSLAPWSVMVMFFCASLVPGFQVDVFGTVVSRGQWLASGGVVLVALGLAIFTGQMFAIIYRVQYATLLLGGAWVAFSIVELLVGPSLSESIVGDPSWKNWSLTAAISAFTGIVAYFMANVSPAQRAYLAKD
jgi:hypothetical protein